MSYSRLAALFFALPMVSAPLHSTQAQQTPEPDKNLQAVLKIHRLLDELRVETKHFQQKMPLKEFLDTLAKQLPKDSKVSLRIDGKAFGPKLAEVSDTPSSLPPLPKKMTLRMVLRLVLSRLETKADFRIDPGAVVITTPPNAQGPLYTATYDIRSIVAKPIFWTVSESDLPGGKRLNARAPGQRAELVVRSFADAVEQGGEKYTPPEQETIEIRNGTQLVIHTSAARHVEIADLLQAFRRLGDLTVSLHAQLYEVDATFYKKLKSVKRIPLEEQERLYLDGKAPKGESLFQLLEKHKLILTGDEVKVDNGVQAALLSHYHAIRCLPSPAQVRKGEKGGQTVFEGVSFLADIQVSSDRRSVSVKLTEKAAELQDLMKVQVEDGILRGDQGLVVPVKKRTAEVTFVLDSSHSQMLEIPDGGSLLVAVHFRSRALQQKDRWYVLKITPRIIIEEEEQQIFLGSLESFLPEVVADVLKNPRLKTVREMYGTPGDKRFALLNSATVPRLQEFQPKVAGFQFTPAKHEGQRLLGIRIDQYQGTDLTLTLLNAGGSTNGAAIGSCTLRYSVRQGDKGWMVELAEPAAP